MTETTTQGAARRGVRTFRGPGLEELLPEIRAELGVDAVIVARRDGVEGGIGGFFGRRIVEVDAVAGAATVDVQDDPASADAADDASVAGAYGIDAYAAPRAATTAGADAAAALDAAAAALRAAAPAPDPDADPEAPREPTSRPEDWAPPGFADQLASLMREEDAAAPETAATPSEDVVVPSALDPDVPSAAEPAAPPSPDLAAPPSSPPAAAGPATPVDDPPALGAPAAPSSPVARTSTSGAPAAPTSPVAPPPTSGAPTAPPAVSTAARPDVDDLDDADALVQAALPADGVVPAPDLPAAPALGPDGDDLLATGLSPSLAAALVHDATRAHSAGRVPDPSPRGSLRAVLAARIPVASPLRGTGGAVLAFAGPGGSGKTRCVARLAVAYASRSELTVACIALRPADEGAGLRALVASAGVDVHVAVDGDALVRCVEALPEDALILVDTPGVSPRVEADVQLLSGELEQLDADEVHLALPATMGPHAARELAAAARALGVTGIALTHVDETTAIGTAVELAMEAGLPLTFVARGVAVDSGMRPASADALALAMLAPTAAAVPAPAPVHRDDELI